MEYQIYRYMEKFHITYNQLLEEPAHIVTGNLLIMSLEVKEEQERQRMEKLKAKHG